MEKTSIKNCLTLCAAFKKTLKVDDLTVAAWHMALNDLPDDLGVEAFGAMSRRVIYGDYEPAHVREEAERIRQRRLSGGKERWISQAPKPPFDEFDGPIFEQWAAEERKKLYRSCDSAGNVYLIQNPHAWETVKNNYGGYSRVRPKPIATGETVAMQGGRPVLGAA